VHFRAAARDDGGVDLSWVRRTRLDGDSWASIEVPLGEELETYRLDIRAGGRPVRSVDLQSPFWSYPAAVLAADRANGPVELLVCQVSNRFGAGPSARLDLG
jgi:hypothetical protein